MSKIKTLTLENFKFFYGENKFEFDSKNVLLYGENGSGKSSIYWSLYTLLQSANKPINEIQKYFDVRQRNTHLLNRFVDENDIGKISIETDDGNTFIISKDEDEINTKDGTYIKEANIASDFINYKLLAKLYDFKHSNTIDLFELFVSDIFDYMKFDENKTYSKVWKELQYKESNPPKKNSWSYNQFKLWIERFNNKFKQFLETIMTDVNTILQDNFYQGLTVEYIYIDLEYDDNHQLKYRKLKLPEVMVTLKYEHDSIPLEHNKNIKKPHSFLNEAKLTAIALSIRLSILRQRINEDNILKILVLDDLLISLDMNNRDIVLNMLLEDEYLQDYHIIMLTHDKAFFEKAKQIFDYRAKNKWNYFEMYVDIEEEKNFEIPYIKKLPHGYGNIEKAKEHFKNKDYPSCANYLRKEVEKEFDDFLQIDVLDEKIKLAKFKENIHAISEVGKNLKKLIEVLKQFQHCSRMPENIQIEKCNLFAEQVITTIEETKKYIEDDFHFEEFEDVKLILKSILHPQSHNDITKPLYKKELEEAIELMEAFNEIIEENN